MNDAAAIVGEILVGALDRIVTHGQPLTPWRRVLHPIAHLHRKLQRPTGWRPIEPEAVKGRDRARIARERWGMSRCVFTVGRREVQQHAEQEKTGVEPE